MSDECANSLELPGRQICEIQSGHEGTCGHVQGLTSHGRRGVG